MCTDHVPPPNLLAGRRAIDGVPGVRILHDWTRYGEPPRWAIFCRVSLTVAPGSPIPPESDWYFVVEPTYPWGRIKCFPAKEGGISKTFQHQLYNSAGPPAVPWRDGDICLMNTMWALGRHAGDTEPFTVDERLAWHCRRAVEWLTCAATGTLVLPGEAFELPEFPNMTGAGTCVAISESPASFAAWTPQLSSCGTVEFSVIAEKPWRLLVRRFRTLDGSVIYEPVWGSDLRTYEADIAGVWLLLPAVPVLDPWCSPATWQELRQACKPMGLSIDDLARRVVPKIRDGKKHVALIGFPVPEIIDGPTVRVHWQGMQFPAVSWGTETANGFRTNEMGYWRRDQTKVFRSSMKLEWLPTSNWDREEIGSRGRLEPRLAEAKILLVGAGALGSVVGELLVRCGAHRVTVVDSETLTIGNLCRHTLTLKDLGRPKAGALAARLNQLSPHAEVTAIDDVLEEGGELQPQIIGRDVVIDCTASDDVIYHLARIPWGKSTLFVSASVGLRARRLFYFACLGNAFPEDTFHTAMAPWLLKERQESVDLHLPREGIGCWHPVFPARWDDLSLFASMTVKQIERSFLTAAEPQLLVFEQESEEGNFIGIRRIDVPEVANA